MESLILGYPRRYVGRYPWLANWLKSQGHAVYPMEMSCRPKLVYEKGDGYEFNNLAIPFCSRKEHYLYGYVDVVSWFHDKLYAWEYKSQHDSIRRGVDQLKNYARSFDYVCLATETSVPTKYELMFIALGAGVYYEHLDIEEGCEKRVCYREDQTPKLQQPEPFLHDKLVARFKRYVFHNGMKQRFTVDQKRLNDFVDLQSRLQRHV